MRRTATGHSLPLQRAESLNARIVHAAVAGRIRFRHPVLAADPLLAAYVREGVAKYPGVTQVRVSAVTGSVLVTFEPSVSAETLRDLIDAAAEGILPVKAHSLSSAALMDGTVPGRLWHEMAAEAVMAKLGTQAERGLDLEEIFGRRAAHGRNELTRIEPRPVLALFAEQLTSLPVALLGVSAALSLLTGGLIDAVVIAAIVVLNATIASATERQAERTILGLSAETPSPVPVVRGGTRHLVAPAELVPGDLLILDQGVLIPADARLVTADDVSINESALTGEALPVHKEASLVLPADTVLSERRNMVFRGTSVTGGRGTALVTATGPVTEIGRMQQLLGTLRPPETPMQRQLGEVERELVIVNGVICAAIFGLGILRGQGLVPMLRSAISLAVAAIPESLPAVATTTLALGIQDMRKREVIVRKIDAVETLGAIEVIGLDKTGTLTENDMAVAALHADGAMLDLDHAEISRDGQAIDPSTGEIARQLLEVSCLCSEAIVRKAPQGRDQEVVGTPTEAALIEAAIAHGIDVPALRHSARVIATVLRGDGRKRMTTLHEVKGGGRLLCVKGDPLEVLARCAFRRTREGAVPLDETARAAIFKANERMAGRALRVLGFARLDRDGDPHDERDLLWLGLAGLANPIRKSVVPMLKRLHGAGIRTVMITGDQSATAFAIARELDLGDGGDLKVLEAGRITGLPKEAIAALAEKPQVFARVSPVDKLNIVKALQSTGKIVAMTGDGINDGPALRAADVGIAMGGAGTDVAREVADIVLASDDLEGIVEAMRLGRATYANIRKVLRYLVSTNAAETFTMLGAALGGGGEALSPIQLLWLNLVSDALPAIALGLEPPEEDVLDHPPHDSGAPILSSADFRRLLREGAVIGGATLAGFFLAGGRNGAPSPSRASTITYHGLMMAQFLHAISCRSQTGGFLREFTRPPSPRLYAGLAASAALAWATQIIPAARRLFGLSPLGLADIVAIGAIAAGSAAVNDILGAVLSESAETPHRSQG